jgi:aryl-alcohol dehydrogenase-like predicted oxidoreductase
MIDAWGDWLLFQELLEALASIAQRHGVSLANVAVRYVLEQPAVAGVIIGARLGVSQHLEENARVFEFSLQPEDYDRIHSISDRSRPLFDLIGDCGDEYRR